MGRSGGDVVSRILRYLLVVVVFAIGACGDGDDDLAVDRSLPVAVLAAFPAELAALLEHMSFDDGSRTALPGGFTPRIETASKGGL